MKCSWRSTSILFVLLCANAVPLAPAYADEAGSGFSSVSLVAIGHGQSLIPFSSVPAEMDIPYASSQIRLGAGTAVSSAAWPGAIGSSLGTTLIVAEPGVPDQAEILNDPVLAKAQSGSGPSTVRNDTVPGVSMIAHATTTDVTAEASIVGVTDPAVAVGATSATSGVQLTGPATAVAEVASSARNISIGGVLNVSAVTSSAHGTTDGIHASAKGRTQVTGAMIAGIPVIIGPEGISVAGNSLPVGDRLATVNAALSQAGLSVLMSPQTTLVKDGSVQYSAGSLIVASSQFGVLSLGGAELNLSASRSDPTSPLDGVNLTTPATGSSAPSVLPGTTPALGQPGATSLGVRSEPQVSTPSPSLARSIVNGLVPVSLQTGYAGVWMVLALVGSVGCASMLRLLPGRWLSPPDVACSLERHS